MLYSSIRRQRSIYILIASLCILLLLLGYLKSRPVEGFSDTADMADIPDIPKIIWAYWHDPQIPPKLKRILDERREVLSTWEHRVLDQTTVYDYIPRDEFPQGYDELSHQHKADWIRLYVLKIYGGCWMDSSIIVNSGDELERLYKESVQTKSEFTGFYLSSHTLDSVNETYIENWFILAPPSSPLISMWYEEFTEAVRIGFLPYKRKVFSKINVSNIYGEYEDDSVYLTQHAALQYVLRHRLKERPNILIYDASDTMFKPHVDCGWKSECVIEYIKNTPKEKQPHYIKLRSSERNAL